VRTNAEKASEDKPRTPKNNKAPLEAFTKFLAPNNRIIGTMSAKIVIDDVFAVI